MGLCSWYWSPRFVVQNSGSCSLMLNARGTSGSRWGCAACERSAPLRAGISTGVPMRQQLSSLNKTTKIWWKKELAEYQKLSGRTSCPPLCRSPLQNNFEISKHWATCNQQANNLHGSVLHTASGTSCAPWTHQKDQQSCLVMVWHSLPVLHEESSHFQFC